MAVRVTVLVPVTEPVVTVNEALVAPEATVTLAGTANCRHGSAFTWTVVSGSKLIVTDTGNNNGWNFNSKAATFAGGGTIDFQSAFCANGNALNTMNMSGGTIILEQTQTSNFGNNASGAFTLTAGTLVFSNATALADTFLNFTNGNVISINGGAIDNLSGSAGTINVGGKFNGTAGSLGKYSIGADFTFIGSTNLSFNTNAVALTATRQITVSNSTLTIGGPISGSGFGLTKAGAGNLTLGGVNTYTGATTVSNGTLALAGSGQLSQSTFLDVMAGATLSVSGRSDQTLTLNSGTVLKGGGTVLGQLNALAGSTVSPGEAIGTLTVSGNVTLAGTLVLENPAKRMDGVRIHDAGE